MAYGELLIEVPVTQLVETLRTNRAKHLKEYEQAKKGYEKLLKRELETKLRVLAKLPRAKQKVTHTNGQSEGDLSRIVNQKPKSYVEFYDQAIEMLDYSVNENIELNTQQFQEFVKDDWNWKASFTTSNVAYAAAARRR